MADSTTALKKVTNAFAQYANPLLNLTQTQIKQMLQSARLGNDVRLQVAFFDMERLCPIFGVCIDKRQAGVLKRKWTISPIDDSQAAKSQAKTVQKIFEESNANNLNGLTAAMQQLVLGAFRGRAVVKPFCKDGALTFSSVQNWNTLQYNNRLFWNPEALEGVNFLDGSAGGLQQLTDDEVCCVLYDRPIDIPGLQTYLQIMIGEIQWARATEKYGVAQVVITPPEGTPDGLTDEWVSRAISIMEGGSGIVPPGSKVDALTAARDQDPFSAYLQHQYENIVLLALGEKLTTLGGSTGLGSNLADVQSAEFDNLVTRDCKLIQNTLTRCAVKKVCRDILKQERLCKFEFTEDEDTTAAEYLEMAEKLNALGATIDLAELKRLTGLSFIKDDAADLWTPKKEAE